MKNHACCAGKLEQNTTDSQRGAALLLTQNERMDSVSMHGRQGRDKHELVLSQMWEMCSCWPLGRKTGKTRWQFGEAQRETSDLSSTETLSVKGRYGRDMLIDPWTKQCVQACNTHNNTH